VPPILFHGFVRFKAYSMFHGGWGERGNAERGGVEAKKLGK